MQHNTKITTKTGQHNPATRTEVAPLGNLGKAALLLRQRLDEDLDDLGLEHGGLVDAEKVGPQDVELLPALGCIFNRVIGSGGGWL